MSRTIEKASNVDKQWAFFCFLLYCCSCRHTSEKKLCRNEVQSLFLIFSKDCGGFPAHFKPASERKEEKNLYGQWWSLVSLLILSHTAVTV
jgi:hypothetical protein